MSALSPILVEAVRALVEVLADHAAGRREEAAAALEFGRIVRDAQEALDRLQLGMDRTEALDEFRRRVAARGLPLSDDAG